MCVCVCVCVRLFRVREGIQFFLTVVLHVLKFLLVFVNDGDFKTTHTLRLFGRVAAIKYFLIGQSVNKSPFS